MKAATTLTPFDPQALLDETAVLACMAYVDLNPIKAGMANRPENSDYTSLQDRLGITPKEPPQPEELQTDPDRPQAELMSFAGVINETTPANVLPHNFADYVALVDWTGRAMREDKRGYIPDNLPPILQRLNIEPEQWLKATKGIERHFVHAIGPVASLEQLCQRLKKRWLHGTSACKALYGSAITA